MSSLDLYTAGQHILSVDSTITWLLIMPSTPSIVAIFTRDETTVSVCCKSQPAPETLTIAFSTQ